MGITGAKSVDILDKWTLKRSDKEFPSSNGCMLIADRRGSVMVDNKYY